MTGSDEMAEADVGAERVRSRVLEAGLRWTGGIVAILVFLFSVQLLGTATEAAEPVIKGALGRVVVDGNSAVGLGWLTTYGLTNGSVVAALSLSLLRSGIVTVSETFLLIAGSRLGGAAIVVLVGVLDYLQERDGRTLSEGTSLGLLTFLVTFTIYVPTTVVGFALLQAFREQLLAATGGIDLTLRSLSYIEPITDVVTRALGAGPTLLVALVLLFGSLWLFDHVLERVETETVRTYVFQHFRRRWMAFGLGLTITGVTTSVAFSLGVVVPLYNRGFVRRREIVPYILGANVGTLFDTLVAAFVLETTAGVAVVLLVMGLATLLTLAVLVGYGPYAAAIDASQDRLLEDRRVFTAFAVLLVAVPSALLLVPHL